MQAYEVPKSEWAEALDQFSRAHVGQRADVDILQGKAASVSEARDLPLIGVMLLQDSRASIEVIAGKPNGPFVGHVVPNARHLRTTTWNDGYSAKLEIESEDGLVTQIRVGPPEETLPPGVITDGHFPHV
jgi:hypothetical protein